MRARVQEFRDHGGGGEFQVRGTVQKGAPPLPQQADPFLVSGVEIEHRVHGRQKRGIEPGANQDVRSLRKGRGPHRCALVVVGLAVVRGTDSLSIVKFLVGMRRIPPPRVVPGPLACLVEDLGGVEFYGAGFPVDDDVAGGRIRNGPKQHASVLYAPEEGRPVQDVVPGGTDQGQNQTVADGDHRERSRNVPQRSEDGWLQWLQWSQWLQWWLWTHETAPSPHNAPNKTVQQVSDRVDQGRGTHRNAIQLFGLIDETLHQKREVLLPPDVFHVVFRVNTIATTIRALVVVLVVDALTGRVAPGTKEVGQDGVVQQEPAQQGIRVA
mmetsp:Transcript_25405/g.53542  ORF Transcript_25405/g.53542 Transcript_25405/m.53542 type:complete len:325 (-) Transcript_25405:503-1477(-)